MRKKIVYIILGLFIVTCASIMIIHYTVGNAVETLSTPTIPYNTSSSIISTLSDTTTSTKYRGPLRGDLPDNFRT